MRSIRVFAKNLGDPYYEPTIVIHDNMNKMANFKWQISKWQMVSGSSRISELLHCSKHN